MKKKHSWLCAALTLVLGIAMLSTAIAAPVYSIVRAPTERLTLAREESAQAGEVLDAAMAKAAALPQQAVIAPLAAQTEVKQKEELLASPASILVAPQLAADLPYPYSWPPGMFDLADHNGSWWVQQTWLDVWSSASNNGYLRNDTLEPDWEDLEEVKLLLPGQSGNYEFTLSNTQAFELDWMLKITDENEDQIPMQFQLEKDGVPVTTGWVGIADLEDAGTLAAKNAAGDSAVFNLLWTWAFEKDDTANRADSVIGSKAGDAGLTPDPESMPYYRLNFYLYGEVADGITPRITEPECCWICTILSYFGLCDCEECEDEICCKWCACENCSPPREHKLRLPIPIPIPVPKPVPFPIVIPVVCCDSCKLGRNCYCDSRDCCCGKSSCDGSCCDCGCAKNQPPKPEDLGYKPPGGTTTGKLGVKTGDQLATWVILVMLAGGASAVTLFIFVRKRGEDEQTA
ncbi:MAG: hypothetical protein FWH26_11215 [Oscillospiraceae bacterium]|nr:hypothetical protein [Oscillospiraceae bacterium]